MRMCFKFGSSYSVYWKNCFSFKIHVSVSEKNSAAFFFFFNRFLHVFPIFSSWNVCYLDVGPPEFLGSLTFLSYFPSLYFLLYKTRRFPLYSDSNIENFILISMSWLWLFLSILFLVYGCQIWSIKVFSINEGIYFLKGQFSFYLCLSPLC